MLFAYGLLALLPVYLAACTANSQDQDQDHETPALPVVSLNTCDTVLQTAYVADIQAIRNVEIRTRVKGFLEKIYIDEGQEVKKGQLLFKISDEEYRVALAKAKAALSNAVADTRAIELETERVKLLVNKKVISKSELDVATAKLNAAKATVAEARTVVLSAENHLAFTNVHAPFNGIIDRIPLKAGSLIEEGTLLTDLSDISTIYAYFSFPENEYLRYERNRKEKGYGQQVSLVLADGSSYPYPGRIETVEGQIEQSTGSIDFRARFPNPKKLLRHGATAKLSIGSTIDSVILVPQQAVFTIQDKNYVYLVDSQNRLHMRSFVPVTRFSNYYVVKQGLQKGERILFEGTQSARDGMQVKPVPAKKAVLALKK